MAAKKKVPRKDAALEAVTSQKNPKIKKAVGVKPVNFVRSYFEIQSSAPLVQHRFSAKGEIMRKQSESTPSDNKQAREPRDFHKMYLEATHRLTDGTYGIPASAFRNALIRACSLVKYKMTIAKMSVFVDADGYDREGNPLVRIHGTPEMHTAHARNKDGGIDIRARPMFKKWKCSLAIRFDADQFTATDMANLLQRAGIQVGLLEGRPASRFSAGMGWGTFEIVSARAQTTTKEARPARSKAS